MLTQKIGLLLTLAMTVLTLTTLAGQCQASPMPVPTDTATLPQSTPTPRPPTATATSTPQSPAPTTGLSTMRLEPDQATAQVGQTAQLSVVIEGAVDLGSFEFAVRFNPALACVTQITLGPFLGSTGRNAMPLGPRIDCAAGQAKFGAFTLPTGAGGPAGSGVVALITFQALATGQTDVSLSEVKATDIRGTPFPVPVVRGATLTVR